ncbi:MAG: TonB-dependent receptor [Bacteroidales bacterium]|nr:TonB-dependent receptor [Bacteroidales bacterium]
MKRLFFYLLAFIIIYSIQIEAQSETSVRRSDKATFTKTSLSIEGKITDIDGYPLAGTLIFIPELNKSCVADLNGHYLLQNLPARNLDVQFSFLGYAHQLKKINASFAGAGLDIRLEPSPIEAEEIVVTGGQHSAQHDNAVKIDVLTLDGHDIQASPNFTETLTRIPGVDMISKGNGVSKPVIRGLSMNDILILNNGVRFENYQYSSHHPLGIDEYGIERVEVIKGPASLLYGSDAIGGVLNFIKEKPAPQHQFQGDYQMQLFSNSLGENSSLGLKGAGEHFFGGVRLSQKSHADYLQGGGDFLPNSRFKEASMKANMGYNASLGSFRLSYDYNQQNLGLVEEEAVEGIDRRGRSNDIFYQRLNTHLLSSQNRLYLGATKLDLNAAFQNTGLTHFGETNEYELQMQLKTLTYEAKLQIPSPGNSAYILGFQGTHQENSNINDRETILLPDALINNYSGFGFLQQSFGRLNVQTGIRYDYKTLTSQAVGNPVNTETYRPALDKDYGSFSGSLGFTYTPAKEILFRGNLATAYRTPNLAELTSNGPHEAIYELGDDRLQPEKSLEFDLSTHWHKKFFTLDLAGFYNRVNDFIFQSPTGETTNSGTSIYRYRQSDSRLYGGEAGLHVHPGSLPWLHIESTYSRVIGKQNSGAYLPFIPADKLRFEVRGEKERLAFFQDAFAEVHAYYAFNQEKPAPEETPTPGYDLYDLSVGGTMQIRNQPLILSLSVNNLLDTKYIDHLSTLKEVGGFNPGRNFIMTLRIPFKW